MSRKTTKDGCVEFHIYLPHELFQQMDAAAQDNERSTNGEIVWRLRQYDRILAPLRTPSDELIARVATAIRDSADGPARAAVAAIVAEIDPT